MYSFKQSLRWETSISSNFDLLDLKLFLQPLIGLDINFRKSDGLERTYIGSKILNRKVK